VRAYLRELLSADFLSDGGDHSEALDVDPFVDGADGEAGLFGDLADGLAGELEFVAAALLLDDVGGHGARCLESAHRSPSLCSPVFTRNVCRDFSEC